jgi:DNA-binding MarR family transcriptional regulator
MLRYHATRVHLNVKMSAILGRVQRDHVDRVVDAWATERPDVDASPIQVIGRVSRLSRQIDQRLKTVFSEHGLEAWEYDLLASLRRVGPPYELTAGEILEASMITSGAVTNRVDRLEQRGYVKRQQATGDRRFVRVRLTRAGLKVMDAALVDHLANEASIVEPLTGVERRQLAKLLRKLQAHLGET